MAFNMLIEDGYKYLYYSVLGYDEYVEDIGEKFIDESGECDCKVDY